MSIHLMNYAWEIKIPTHKKIILMALCDWANDEGVNLHPSIKRIAERASMSERNVQRVMREMIDDGLIEVIGNFSGGKPGSSRHYRLNVDYITEQGLAAIAERARNRSANLPETGDAGVTGDNLSRVTDATFDTPRRVTDSTFPPPRRVTDTTETGDAGVTLTTIEPPVRAKASTKRAKATTKGGACAQLAADASRSAKPEPKSRTTPVEKPGDVDPGIWADWLALRRAKRAPVTETVLKSAISEARLARMSLNDFLTEWCVRGSQGLKASWLAAKGSGGWSQAAPAPAPDAVLPGGGRRRL